MFYNNFILASLTFLFLKARLKILFFCYVITFTIMITIASARKNNREMHSCRQSRTVNRTIRRNRKDKENREKRDRSPVFYMYMESVGFKPGCGMGQM